MNSVADNLKAAKDLLQTHGFCKGLLRDAGGKRCINGAMNTVVMGDALVWTRIIPWIKSACPEVLALYQVVREQWPDRISPALYSEENAVAEFNNHLDTTLDDVLLAFDKAILSVGGSL